MTHDLTRFTMKHSLEHQPLLRFRAGPSHLRLTTGNRQSPGQFESGQIITPASEAMIYVFDHSILSKLAFKDLSSA